MVNTYVKKALIVERKFKRAFNTDESLILQYQDCYACKLAISGIEIEVYENWLEVMQDLYVELDEIIRSLSKVLGVSVNLAYELLVKSM